MIESGFDLDPRQLLVCNTEVYGLISGPSWLRQSLVSFFLSNGYVRNHYEKCALALPPTSAAEPGKAQPVNEGVVLIEVDDTLEGGNERHQAIMERFYAIFKCGRRKRLIDLRDEGTLISGVRVRQFPDKHFEWDMSEYAQDKTSGMSSRDNHEN